MLKKIPAIVAQNDLFQARLENIIDSGRRYRDHSGAKKARHHRRKRQKRCNAIEPIIGHCKNDRKVGPVLTAALIGQMPELGTVGEKQIAALAGVAPINHDSGKYAGKRRIRGGRTWLRHLLYQAVLVASNHNPALKIFAKRLKEKGKPHKLVLIAVARKLIIIANALLAKNVKWKTV